jgi:RNA polymerase sigma-70 factor (ECF subfamily)
LQRRLPTASGQDRAPSARSAAESALVERFTEAFESSDVDGVVRLLTDDVRFAMPPMPFEWQGRQQARQFFVAIWGGRRGRRLIETRANGQPAFGLYYPDPHGRVLHAAGLLALHLAGDRISAITRFDTSVLEYFDLRRTLATTDERTVRRPTE